MRAPVGHTNRSAAVPDAACRGSTRAGPSRRSRAGSADARSSSGTSAARNSIRTLPYVQAWHERYGPHGLRVIGVHCPGLRALRATRAGGARRRWRGSAIAYPVLIDSELEVWQDCTRTSGWPARYLFDRPRHACSTTTTARARYDGDRARDPGAARASRSSRVRARCAPEDAAGRAARRRRPRTSRRPLLRALRGGRRVGGARRQRRRQRERDGDPRRASRRLRAPEA